MQKLDKGMGMEEFVEYLIDLAEKNPEIFKQIEQKNENRTKITNNLVTARGYLTTSYSKQVVR